METCPPPLLLLLCCLLTAWSVSASPVLEKVAVAGTVSFEDTLDSAKGSYEEPQDIVKVSEGITEEPQDITDTSESEDISNASKDSLDAREDVKSASDEMHVSLAPYESVAMHKEGSETENTAEIPEDQPSISTDVEEKADEPNAAVFASDKETSTERVLPALEEAGQEIGNTVEETMRPTNALNNADEVESVSSPQFLEDVQNFTEGLHDIIQYVEEFPFDLQAISTKRAYHRSALHAKINC